MKVQVDIIQKKEKANNQQKYSKDPMQRKFMAMK
jgi:hypothetical protein